MARRWSVAALLVVCSGSLDPSLVHGSTHDDTQAATAAAPLRVPRLAASNVSLAYLRDTFFAHSVPFILQSSPMAVQPPFVMEWHAQYIKETRERGGDAPKMKGWSGSAISYKIPGDVLGALAKAWAPLPFGEDLDWNLVSSAGWGGADGKMNEHMGGIHLHDDYVCFYQYAVHMSTGKRWSILAGPPAGSNHTRYEEAPAAGDVLLWPQYLPHGSRVESSGWSINSRISAAPGGRYGSLAELYAGALPARCLPAGGGADEL